MSLLGCFLEVLAGFRPDLLLAAELDQIDADPVDAVTFPTQPAGQLPRSWLDPRVAGSSTLTGTYCSVTTTDTLAILRPVFISRALRFGLPDLDAAALRLAESRALTQAVSVWLYEHYTAGHPTFDGVHFHSRHGDDQGLSATSERGTDQRTGPHLADQIMEQLIPDHAQLRRAMSVHNLQWADVALTHDPDPLSTRRNQKPPFGRWWEPTVVTGSTHTRDLTILRPHGLEHWMLTRLHPWPSSRCERRQCHRSRAGHKSALLSVEK